MGGFTRRGFIAGSMAGGAALMLPNVALAQAATERRLLFILQRGAADGIGMLAPLGDPDYLQLRREIAEEGGHAVDAFFSLHPALAGVARLAAAGEARILANEVLAALDPADPALVRDAERLEAVRGERRAAADQYFARNAATWDEIRSLHVAEDRVEAAILRAAGPSPFERLVDLGTGSGRMLTLLGGRARSAVGLDLSQQMLNVARARVEAQGLASVELRHGDIFATRLPDGCADLVVVHQVLHYLGDPSAAVREASRLTGPGGRLVIVDFAPHALEVLREQHQHRRLGFSAVEMKRWLAAAGLRQVELETLPPARAEGLTVCVWTARRSPA